MLVPPQAVRLIKEWEGFRHETYFDSAGVPTIGYGTTARAGVGIVPVPGMTITEREAEFYLIQSITKFAKLIRPGITVPINQNEWSAFLSIAYNIGPNAFLESTFLRRFNDSDKAGCAEAMLWWNKAGGRVLRGLERRRRAEVELFLKAPKPKKDWGGIFRTIILFLKTIFGRAKT